MQRLWDLFLASGAVGWPLLLFSILAFGCGLERSLFWSRLFHRQPRVLKESLKAYAESPGAAIDLLRRNMDLPMARVFLPAMMLDSATSEEFSLAIESEVQAELPGLKRFNSLLDMIVTLSPLLGLLGTVLGLIQSFAGLGMADVGGTKTAAVTGGISEALVSTAFGLVVAIGVFFMVSIFRGFYSRELATIQEYAAKLELIHRRRNNQELYATSNR